MHLILVTTAKNSITTSETKTKLPVQVKLRGQKLKLKLKLNKTQTPTVEVKLQISIKIKFINQMKSIIKIINIEQNPTSVQTRIRIRRIRMNLKL